MKKLILLSVFTVFAVLSANAQKFALIDMEYICERIPEYVQGTAQLEKLSSQYQTEVEAMAAEVKTLFTDYQDNYAKLSDAQKAQKEEAIVSKEREVAELKRKYFGNDGEMAKQQQQLLGPIEDDVYEAVKQISERNGYSLVLDRASATSVIFASPRIDISDEVLSALGYSN